MFESNIQDVRNILLVENDPLSSSEVRGVLTESGVAGRLHRVADTQEAIAYLRRDAPYFAAPRPHVVVLGEGLQSGLAEQIVREVRRNPSLRDARVLEITRDERTTQQNGTMRVPLAELGSAIVVDNPTY